MPMLPRIRRGPSNRPPTPPPGGGTPRIETVEGAGTRWLYIEQPTVLEMSALAEQFEFHPLDFEDCLSRRQRPKVDEYDSYLFVVLHFPLYDKAMSRLTTAELDIFIGADFLVTVSDRRLRPVHEVFTACQERPEDRDALFRQGPGYLLYTLLAELFAYGFPVLDKIGAKLDQIEDRIFEGHARAMVEEISTVKQEIIAYRKIIKPMLGTLRVLEMKTSTRYIPDSLDIYFDDIIDAGERMWDMLENYKEVVEAIEGTNESLIQHRLNDILLVLTMMSVVFLPLTLLSSVYGMNVGLPLAEDANAFWYLSAAMAAIAALMVGFFRWRRWF